MARLNIKEMAYPNDFDIEEFKTISSFAKRIKYCQERLQRISSGSGRIVYKIDDERVLKLAKNPKGVAQNEVETDQSNDYYLRSLGIVAETYEYHPKFFWLEMELCKKLTPSRFRTLTEISIEDLDDALYYTGKRIKGIQVRKPNIDWDNEFVSTMINYIVNYNLPTGDLGVLNSYGENSQQKVVVIDFGLNWDVYEKHYT